jgi:type IV secretory pathway VirB4 component
VPYVEAAPEYQATTVQACGLFPFTAGSGSPSVGVPFGRHMMWGEVVCCDPFAWMDAGLTTNRGMFFLGQPGTGKSSGGKRICRGCMAFGVTPLFLGDAKPDYSAVVKSAGGQVIRIGRGLDRINPLDAGPLGQALSRLSGAAAQRLRHEVRGRRLNATLALCSLVRTDSPMTNAEETVIGAAVDVLADRTAADPTIPDVLRVLREGPDRLVSAAEVETADEYRSETRRLRQTLRMLCEGSLKGVFDGPTSTPIDLDAPAVSVDISAVTSAGDTLLSAAMLSTWSYGFAVIDAAAALTDAGLAPSRRFLAVLDELWRALRGAPGLVDHADALTRVYRGRNVAHMMMTHSLDDLNALPTEADRAKARGFIDRCAITVLAGLPMRELDEVARIVPLSEQEKLIVASWSSPETWQPGARHPGRGKYLIKTGQRVGIPVELEYVGDEAELYNTDGSAA